MCSIALQKKSSDNILHLLLQDSILAFMMKGRLSKEEKRKRSERMDREKDLIEMYLMLQKGETKKGETKRTKLKNKRKKKK